jgi:hypothetical protein
VPVDVPGTSSSKIWQPAVRSGLPGASCPLRIDEEDEEESGGAYTFLSPSP